jgi:Polyketide cyclase / dehydrase and lipid transport
VAGYATDPDNAMNWYVNIKDVRWETPRPVVVGSRVAFEARFLGRSISYVYEVREIVPDERFVMATADGPFPMRTTYSWVDLPGGGTRMTLRNAGEPSGFGSVTAPMLAAALRRANRKDLAQLKAILELADPAERTRRTD